MLSPLMFGAKHSERSSRQSAKSAPQQRASSEERFNQLRDAMNQYPVGSPERQHYANRMDREHPARSERLANEVIQDTYARAWNGDPSALNSLVEARRATDPNDSSHRGRRNMLTDILNLLGRGATPSPERLGDAELLRSMRGQR